MKFPSSNPPGGRKVRVALVLAGVIAAAAFFAGGDRAPASPAAKAVNRPALSVSVIAPQTRMPGRRFPKYLNAVKPAFLSNDK